MMLKTAIATCFSSYSSPLLSFRSTCIPRSYELPILFPISIQTMRSSILIYFCMALASSPALAAPILASRQDPNTAAPGLVRPYRGALVAQQQSSQRSWSTQTLGPSQRSDPSSYDLPTYHQSADPNSNRSGNQDGSNVGRSLQSRHHDDDDDDAKNQSPNLLELVTVLGPGPFQE